MGTIKKRSRTFVSGTAGSDVNALPSWQIYKGSGLLLGAFIDITTMSSTADYKIYDVADGDAMGFQVYPYATAGVPGVNTVPTASAAKGPAPRKILDNSTVVTDVDGAVAGTVAAFVTDGLDEAGGSAANTSLGLPFFNGLYQTYEQEDDTITTVFNYLIMPLQKYEGQITSSGSAGSAAGNVRLGPGPGVIRALAYDVDPNIDAVVSVTHDIELREGSATGAKIFTVSPSAQADQAPISLVTDGVDEILGSIANIAGSGAMFLGDLYAALAQADAVDRAITVRCLVQA